MGDAQPGALAPMMRAKHLDGPMAGEHHDVSLSAPSVPEEIWYGKVPGGSDDQFSGLTPAGYVLVGFKPGFPPRGGWPGLAHYRLDRERSQLTPHPQYDGMEQGTAVYVHVDPQEP
jgi:hypothetical protein